MQRLSGSIQRLISSARTERPICCWSGSCLRARSRSSRYVCTPDVLKLCSPLTREVWMRSMIPYTETGRAPSSRSSAFSCTHRDCEAPSQSDLAEGLQSRYRDVEHSHRFDMQSGSARESQLAERLGAEDMDQVCRMTSQDLGVPAHLLKRSNPDVVSVSSTSA